MRCLLLMLMVIGLWACASEPDTNVDESNDTGSEVKTPSDACNSSSLPGATQPQPDRMCTQQYDPVCGCDGKTYSNACMASLKQVNVLHAGACKGGSSAES